MALKKPRKALSFLGACWDKEEDTDQGCPFTLLDHMILLSYVPFKYLSKESLYDCTEKSSSLKKTVMSEILSNISVSS